MTGISVSYSVRTRKWYLRGDLKYIDGQKGVIIRVPDCFQFDLASVPRILWPLIAPFEMGIEPPAVHDYLYKHKGNTEFNGKPYKYSRRQTDRLFERMMRQSNVPLLRRKIAYLGVRIGGWWHWYDWPQRLKRHFGR